MKLDYRKLANQLMFDLSDEEVKELDKEFDTLLKQIDLLDTINTDGVEPMEYPFEAPTVFLREDVVENVLEQADVLKNVKKERAGHILVPKVVK